MKDYDYYVNKRNTRHLTLYTWLIGLFQLFLGINLFILFLHSKIVLQHNEMALCWLGLSILMFILIPLRVTDQRRQERDLLATVLDGILHSACTLFFVYLFSFWILFIIYVIEMLLIVGVMVKYFREQRPK